MSTPASFFANRYRLVESLGRGGMGEVWRAYDERLNRYCAIKVLRQMQDGATVERFSREARTLASLRHPGVVTVYDYGVDNDRPFLVMELLPGPSLAEMLREQGPLPFEVVRRYGAQSASALQAVHDAGVVHRDIKPANLVVDNSGQIRLVDFGIALGQTSTDHTLTEHGAIIGSAAYLAPEQAVGGRADARSDLYGFGCLLMTLLTGKPPFDDDAPVEILGRHLNDAPPRPSDRRPDTPPDIDDLVMQLLAKEPEQRPASAAEVASRLGWTAGRPLPGPVPMPPRTYGSDPGATVAYPAYAGGTAATVTTASHAARGGGRGRKAGVVLGVLALLGAAGAGAWALAQSENGGGGTSIPFISPTPTPSAKPTKTPKATATATASPTPSSTATVGPPPAPSPLPPGPTPIKTTPPAPIITIPPVITPKPVPTAELNALASEVESAQVASVEATDTAPAVDGAAAKQQLRDAVRAIRAEAEANRRSAAAGRVDEFVAKVGELEGSGALDPETADKLRQAAKKLRDKLTA